HEVSQFEYICRAWTIQASAGVLEEHWIYRTNRDSIKSNYTDARRLRRYGVGADRLGKDCRICASCDRPIGLTKENMPRARSGSNARTGFAGQSRVRALRCSFADQNICPLWRHGL